MVWASGKAAHWTSPLGGVPGMTSGEDPGLGGEIISQHWPGNASGSPRQSWLMWPGKGRSGAPAGAAAPATRPPRDPSTDKRIEDEDDAL